VAAANIRADHMLYQSTIKIKTFSWHSLNSYPHVSHLLGDYLISLSVQTRKLKYM
jgi:hypothetical protein